MVSRIIPVTFLAAALLAGAAGADEPKAGPLPELKRQTSAEILAHVDETKVREPWLAHQLDRFSIQKGTGVAYTRGLAFGDRDLELSVQGPAVGKKAVGVGFELRF